MAEVKPAVETFAKIVVLGIGGAGGAALNRMIDEGVRSVDFVAINTDAQALHNNKAQHKIHIGRDTTRGLGAGADPIVGQKAAEESKDDIKAAIEGADMVFITFGGGGGTGSGAAPIVAELTKDLGVLSVGIATKPFAFEGDKRRKNAEVAIESLSRHVDTLITIPNDRLLQTIDRRTPLLEAFKVADEVLRQGVQGISDLITIHGLINLDFADVKAVMSNAGSALMGIGRASGENRALTAAQQAIESPLLEVSIDGARGVLFNVSGGHDMSMHEINEAAEAITAAVDPDANIIFGATLNPDMSDEIAITVIATGFDASYFKRPDEDGGLSYFSDDDEDEAGVGPKRVDTEQDEIDDDIDLNLSSSAKGGRESSFEDEDDKPAPSIWSYSTSDEELDMPTFVRKRKSEDKKAKEKEESGDKKTKRSVFRRKSK
ncbi:MAG TPA: cell division protein FtsZ [Candidatus Saccharimonadales bacterium]